MSGDDGIQAWAPIEVVEGLLKRAEKAEAARDRLANQLLNEVPDSYIQMKARALDAEAAIQRVRGTCGDKYVGPPTEYGQGFQEGYNDALAQVLRALGGDQ